jgi:hypothetical protein
MTTPLDAEALEIINAGLSDLERELIMGTSKGWGSWMWGVSGDLVRKGLMFNEAPGVRALTPRGEAVRAILSEQHP